MNRHVLYEGDNLPILETLLSESVDTIYIDPPYNTHVDREYRDDVTHEEWVSSIYARLVHAHRLLRPTGVIFVSIGDDELARLRLVLDEVFGEENFLRMLVWQSEGRTNGSFGLSGTDYILAFAKKKAKAMPWREPKPHVDEFMEITRREFESARMEGCSHPDEQAGVRMRAWARQHESWMTSWEFSHHGIPARPGPLTARSAANAYHYEVVGPDGTLYRPVSGWRLPKETFDALASQDLIMWNGIVPRKVLLLSEHRMAPPSTVFSNIQRNPGTHLRRLMGRHVFDSPKDYRVLMRWIDMVTPEGGTVLDFYCGTGSTVEAVVRLNEQGHAYTVIGIEDTMFDVLWERTSAVLSGISSDDVKVGERLDQPLDVILSTGQTHHLI